MVKRTTLIVLLVALLALPGAALAQDDEKPTEEPTEEVVLNWPLPAQVEAADGLLLVGDLYLVDPVQPTVILLHELYTDRSSWAALIDPLIWAGYNVLNVDQRGHGATGGEVDWWAAVDDVQSWLDWLRTQIGVRADAISIIGSSMGANVALESCANDAACRTVIALSPGWRTQGLTVSSAFHDKFGDRPVLLVYARGDFWPAYGIPLMLETATNPVTVQDYPGNAHGMLLFDTVHDELIARIIDWLNATAAG